MNVSRPRSPLTRLTLAACVSAGVGMTASGVENPDFYKDVFPFLKANCISCHNKTTTKAGLNMETPELMKKGGDSGPGLVPGKSLESLIVEASVHTVDMEMPPPNNKSGAVQLSVAEIGILKTWIDQGAKASVQQERQVTWKPLAPGVDPIYSVALTQDGRYAACGRSNRIFLYDLATRQFVTEITDPAEAGGGAHRAMVQSLTFSPDGTRLVSGSFREVKVWKLGTAAPVMKSVDLTHALTMAFPSEDGKTIVGLNKEGAILLIGAADGKLSRRLDGVLPAGAKWLGTSPDASQAVVLSSDKTLTLWDLGAGKVIATESSVSGVSALAWSGDGKSFATAGEDRVIRVWSVPAPTAPVAAVPAAAVPVAAAPVAAVPAAAAAPVASVPAAAAPVAAVPAAAAPVAAAPVAAAPVAAAPAPAPAAVVAAAPAPKPGFAAPKEFKGATGVIKMLVASKDGKSLISSSEDGKIRVWNLSDGKTAFEFAAPGVLHLAPSADGKSIVTAGSDGVIRLWDLASGKAITEMRGSPALSKEVAAHEWTIARETLEQAFQKTEVARIEAQNKALDELLKKSNDAIVEMKKVLPEKVKAVKPVEDEKLVAKKVVDDVIALIAASPGGKGDAALEKQLKDAQEKLGPVSMKVVSALAAVSATENNIRDAEVDGKLITESKTKNAALLEASHAAIAAAKASLDKATADLAAVKAGESKRMGQPLAVALSPDGERAASVFADGKLVVWAVKTGIPLEEQAGTAVTSATLQSRPDGRFAATMSDGKTIVSSPDPKWALERLLGGDKDHSLFADRVNAVRFSPDGKLLAAGGGEPSRSGDVTLFDLSTGKATATWKDRHDDIVMCLDFSPDGKLLASGAADKIVRVVEVDTGKQVNLFEGHTHYVMGLAFRADGRVLASAGADGVVSSWDMILGERKKKIEGWTKEVTSLQFIGATNQMVTSAGDNRVRIVNDDGGEVRSITGLPDFMQAAASTANGATLVGGGEDSSLRVWNGADGKEVAVFEMK